MNLGKIGTKNRLMNTFSKAVLFFVLIASLFVTGCQAPDAKATTTTAVENTFKKLSTEVATAYNTNTVFKKMGEVYTNSSKTTIDVSGIPELTTYVSDIAFVNDKKSKIASITALVLGKPVGFFLDANKVSVELNESIIDISGQTFGEEVSAWLSANGLSDFETQFNQQIANQPNAPTLKDTKLNYDELGLGKSDWKDALKDAYKKQSNDYDFEKEYKTEIANMKAALQYSFVKEAGSVILQDQNEPVKTKVMSITINKDNFTNAYNALVQKLSKDTTLRSLLLNNAKNNPGSSSLTEADLDEAFAQLLDVDMEMLVNSELLIHEYKGNAVCFELKNKLNENYATLSLQGAKHLLDQISFEGLIDGQKFSFSGIGNLIENESGVNYQITTEADGTKNNIAYTWNTKATTGNNLKVTYNGMTTEYFFGLNDQNGVSFTFDIMSYKGGLHMNPLNDAQTMPANGKPLSTFTINDLQTIIMGFLY